METYTKEERGGMFSLGMRKFLCVCGEFISFLEQDALSITGF